MGQTISHYRVTEKLGESGMGIVYKAEDTQLRRAVALKAFSKETIGDDEIRARLVRVAQAAARDQRPKRF